MHKIAMGLLVISLNLLLGGCNTLEHKTASNPQKYPAKPITLIVPFTAGGSVDSMARALEKTGYKYLGQPLIVLNKPGGGGTIGWNELAGAKPDGYTIGMASGGVILHSIYGQSKYNYSTALEPLAKMANTPVVMSLRKSSKWSTLDEFIAYAKAHPGEIKYGHSGLGTATNVVGEMFAYEAGIKIEQVPFQGDAESIAALLGEHVDVIFGTHTPLKEYLKSGMIRSLAVADNHRLADAEFLAIPTFKEQGFNVEVSNWVCIAAPKELPGELKDKLARQFKQIINDPEFQATIKELGFAVEYLGPEDCIKEWTLEYQHLSKVVQQTGIAERITDRKK